MTGFGPFGLEGRRAVVTGGAMGIGRGIVRRFLEAGADVLVVDVDEGALALAADDVAGLGKVEVLAADVSDGGTGAAVVAAARERLGGVDVLVNNAGIFPQVPLLELPEETLDRVLGINLRGLMLLTKAVAADMVAAGNGGAIVNMASIDALHPSMVGLAAYDASKGGVWMFTKSLALELAPHRIRVNAIAPGGIATEGTSRPLEGTGMTAEAARKVLEDFVAQKVPLGRMGEPDDIALATVFLASAAAGYVTGSLLVVDGGTLLA